MLADLQPGSSGSGLTVPSEGAERLAGGSAVASFVLFVRRRPPGVGGRFFDPVDLQLLQRLAG